MQFKKITVATGDRTKKGTGVATPKHFFAKRNTLLRPCFLGYPIEIGCYCTLAEQLRKNSRRAVCKINVTEVPLKITLEPVLTQSVNNVLHNAFIIALIIEPH